MELATVTKCKTSHYVAKTYPSHNGNTHILLWCVASRPIAELSRFLNYLTNNHTGQQEKTKAEWPGGPIHPTFFFFAFLFNYGLSLIECTIEYLI